MTQGHRETAAGYCTLLCEATSRRASTTESWKQRDRDEPGKTKKIGMASRPNTCTLASFQIKFPYLFFVFFFVLNSTVIFGGKWKHGKVDFHANFRSTFSRGGSTRIKFINEKRKRNNIAICPRLSTRCDLIGYLFRRDPSTPELPYSTVKTFHTLAGVFILRYTSWFYDVQAPCDECLHVHVVNSKCLNFGNQSFAECVQ